MSYLVLARKWRPRTFSDLVGQEHVAQTLRNAIVHDRVAHAFLFTGARGVGKTTIARILAKALNCLDRTSATPEPCGTCAACMEIAAGRDPDVQEIDGASNNGVDDVRRLQETLPYRPQRDRFKVVIIDEVHMVTTAAFNALLKTLEEPPPHVKFIFATTEAHKVPITILSRCQRYDFRLIPTQKIREHLAHILRVEGIPHDDAAVALVAREAAGSLRDALSLLDQVIAGIDGALTGVAAARLLGVADRKVLYDLVRSVLSGDAVAALRTLESIAREGYDLANVARGVLGVARDLVVARVVPDPAELLDLADDERTEVQALAAGAEPVDLERLFVAWARTVEDVARAREPRWVMEMAAVRLCHRPALLPVEELVGRLTDLERRLAAGGGTPPADPHRPAGSKSVSTATSPSGGPAPVGMAPATPRAGAPTGGSTPGGAPQSPAGGRFTLPSRPGTDPSRAQSVEPATATVPVPLGGGPAPGPTATATATAVAPRGEDWLGRARQRATEPRPSATVQPSHAPPGTLPSGTASERPQVAAEPLVDVSSAARVMAAWQQVVNAVEGSLVPVLKGAVPLTVDAARVRLAIDTRDSFFRKKLATPEAQTVVADAAARVFGERPVVELVQGTLPEGALSIARMEENARNEERARRESVARAHPLVQAVAEVLGGEIGRVRLEGDPT